MTEVRKRKLRRDRVTNLSILGLEPGKLYSFQGNYRYLYKEQKADYSRIYTKIRRNEYVMFFEADLWKSTATKKKIVADRFVPNAITKLEKQGCIVLNKKRHLWHRGKTQINYKFGEPIYSGMMYIGYEDKFGWINIVQMSKKNILEQFNKVELNHD